MRLPSRSLARGAAVAALTLALAGSPGLAAAAPAPGDPLAAYRSIVETLGALGVQPFLYPTAAPFCADGAPLGLAPAVAGAVPGPWPGALLPIPGLDQAAVRAGQVMFTFLPAGITDGSGMQVLWFNTATGRGGAAAMGSLGDVAAGLLPAVLPPELRAIAEAAVRDFLTGAIPVGGVRAAPVDTGRGTVLAAVFGSARNGDTTCFFLPTIGIVSA